MLDYYISRLELHMAVFFSRNLDEPTVSLRSTLQNSDQYNAFAHLFQFCSITFLPLSVNKHKRLTHLRIKL